MSKEEMLSIMGEYVEIVVSVECQNDKCSKSESDWDIDEYDFAKKLYKKGWRIKNEELLCPKCSKQQL